jgi:DNA-binding NtrC family response regulator
MGSWPEDPEADPPHGGPGGDRVSRSSPDLTDLSVLVVDDDLDLLHELRDQLAGSLAHVLIAQTPLAALWILDREPVHVVLCDLVLGSSHGGHLLEHVQERWPRAARILMTGFGDRVVDQASFPAAQRVVLKPCDSGTLLSVIGELRPAPVTAP